MDQLEKQEMYVSVFVMLDKLKPVGDGFHLVDLVEILTVDYTHCHDDNFLLFKIQTCHKLHKQLVPEYCRLLDLH